MTPPIAILYVGAYLERRGYNVSYFDERWDSDFREELLGADVVGVSAMSGFQLQRAVHYLKEAKEAGKITIIGGPHCTVSPQTCLNKDFIDYVVVGEGEVTLLELLENLDNPANVPGVLTNNNRLRRRAGLLAEEIESPITDNTLRYFMLASQTNDVMLPSSRGCPFSCGFCINSKATIDGKRWRPIPLDRWSRDLDRLLESGIRIEYMQIGDDWLGTDQRMLEVGRIMKKRGIRWLVSLRATQVKENLIKELINLNCSSMAIGIESGSEEVLTLMDKKITISDATNCAEILARNGIKAIYFFLLGVPTETWAQKKQTMELADRINNIHRGCCAINLFAYNPYEGTTLYDLAKKENIPTPTTLEEWFTTSRSHNYDPLLTAVYYIAGITFHRARGSTTDRNFPGIRRGLILPFELLCVLRWKIKFFYCFWLERKGIELLLKYCRAQPAPRQAP